jgi:tartrate-resistant acid phosphatase type 5
MSNNKLYILVVHFMLAIGSSIDFAVYGDWGSDTSALRSTVRAVASRLPGRNFVILAGDNAYPAGFSSVNDPQFDLFDSVVASGVSYPHYMILGNHDYMGSIEAQLDYAKRDSRWVLPSRYYKQTMDRNGVKLCLLFIDTVNFDDAQASWLSTQLRGDDCFWENAWPIVVGHYPIWSSGAYTDDHRLVETLLPILRQNHVQLYLSGHEHLHEVFYDDVVVQVTSGASCCSRSARTFQPHSNQIWGVSGANIFGFIQISATVDNIDVEIVSSQSGRSFVHFTINRSSTKDSMFGHIDWSYQNSNKDAPIADKAVSLKIRSDIVQIMIVLICTFSLF